MTTTNQIAANQANSLLSTGPTSEAGKLASSRNALKHGLSGKGLILPDEEQAAAKERAAELNSSLKPFDAFELSLVEQIAVEEIRAASCRAHQNAHRDLKARRAIDFWDLDRRLAAEVLASGLHKKPEIVARQLQQTRQGNELLINRWQALAGSLYKNGDWDESQRSMALDLMGVPRAVRDARANFDPPEGTTVPAWLDETVAHHISMLQEQMPALEELDGHEQEMATYGLDPSPDSELKRLRRYESAALRRMQWAYKQLQDRKSGRQPRPARNERPRPPNRLAMTSERKRKKDEELDALRFETWKMMAEVGVYRELCSEDQLREAALQNVSVAQKAPVVVPPKPTDSSPPPPPFRGNRQARRAAELKARQARRS